MVIKMTLDEIRKNKPNGATYYAYLYDQLEYLKTINGLWYWWNGYSWLYCREKTVKSLNLIVI